MSKQGSKPLGSATVLPADHSFPAFTSHPNLHTPTSDKHQIPSETAFLFFNSVPLSYFISRHSFHVFSRLHILPCAAFSHLPAVAHATVAAIRYL
jgi:hypothetical protein